MADPVEAYKAAKAHKAILDQQKLIEEERISSLPERAEAVFRHVADTMKQSLPPELTIEDEISLGGLLGPRGVKGLFFKLYEGQSVIAQCAFTCRDDELVFFQGFAPDRDPRPSVELGNVVLSALSPEKANDVLSQVIYNFLC